MNGAELPCSSVLHVEPSSSTYGQKKDQEVSHYGPSTASSSAAAEETDKQRNDEASKVNAQKTEDEDLDDFFASL